MRRTRILAGCGTVAITALLTLGFAGATWATTSTSGSPGALSAAQVSDQSTVASFASTHAAPILPADATPAQFAAFSQSLETYWNSVPWSAVAGQWGCTVQSVDVDYGADGIANSASVTTSGQCAGASQLTKPASAQLTQAVQTIAPRSQTLTLPQNADLAKVYGGSLASSSDLAATPDSAGWTQICNFASPANLCLGAPETGEINAEGDWNGPTVTASLRLGQSSLTSCTAGSLVKQSSSRSVADGGYISITASVSVDANWSNEWLDPGVQSRFCQTI
jgi:hypothetical protein